jgi:hypothetical protein
VTTEPFPSRYATARRAFLDAAARAGAAIESIPHPESGPEGEDLALDVARFGPGDATRVLVIASGTHGVEGRAGSGIQRAIIDDDRLTRLPEGVAVVLLHAVNPYGFAHSRRVDHANVDVNRNFVDHAAPPENPAYEGLFDVLNPTELELDDRGWRTELEAFGAERGLLALFQATMGGQYRHPRGLQFGGSAPTWSRGALGDVWRRHLAGAQVAASIDLHTGLGPGGVGSVLQSAGEGEPAAELAAAWWGGVGRSDRPGEGDALTCGLTGPGFEAAAPTGSTAVFVTLEYGTIEPLAVLDALRADNWLHHHGDVRSATGAEIADRMRSAFFVAERAWEDRVLDRAHEVVGQALAGIAGS